MSIQKAMAARIGVVTCALLIAVGCGGCSNYYKVTDPTTGRVYYTKEMERKQGAVTLRDGATGDRITVQNSEVKEISKEAFSANKAKSGQAPEVAIAPPPAAPVAEGAAIAGATVAGAAAASGQSADAFKTDLIKGKEQIDRTLASLTELTDPQQTNLNLAYKNYTDQVAATKEHAARIKREADAMREAQASYFSKWDQKLAEIDNPTLRQSVEARRAKLRAAQEQLTASSGQAREAYQAFVKDLDDIQKYLATDLSKESTAVMGATTKKALVDGDLVKKKIDVVVGQLNAIEGTATAAPAGGIAPAVPPPQ